MATKAKKLTINVKRPVEAPQDLFDTKWSVLRKFIGALYAMDGGRDGKNGVSASFSYEELYGAVMDVCMHKAGDKLYTQLRNEFGDRAEKLVAGVEACVEDDSALLVAAQRMWAVHCTEMTVLRAVFTYLDTTVVVQGQAQGFKSLWETSLDVLRSAIVRRSSLLPRLVHALAGQIKRERCGETIDRPVMQAVIRACVALQLYGRDVEPALVRGANEFYRSEGNVRMSSYSTGGGAGAAGAGSSSSSMWSQQAAGASAAEAGGSTERVSSYLQYTDSCLLHERDRVNAYLPASTLRPFIAAVDAHLIGAHLASIIDTGFRPLMEHARLHDLQRLHSLASRVHRSDEVRIAFGAYCKSKAVLIVGDKDDEEKDKVLVPSLIGMRDEMGKVIKACFSDADPFHVSLKNAVEVAVNSRENKPAELVARYLDGRLRSGAKGVGTEVDVEADLDKVMALFKCVHGKDVFEAFYKKDLAKRLLLGRSASLDVEKSMVSRLKTECGSQFTSKLEGMFKDVELAKELHNQFVVSKHVAAHASSLLGVEMNVHVLTSSYWPTYTYMPAVLPPELSLPTTTFEAFYKQKYSSNRKLQWQHSLGHCLLKAQFPSGRKELDVSLSQTLVLLLFNGPGVDSLPFTRIKEETGLEDAECRRTLQSLACGQVRVLRKEPKGREVEDGDVFHYNTSFTDPKVRVKINQIQMKETKQEIDQTNERVFHERQYQMDAAIVRIMKSRKSLTHQVLMSELLAQLRFPAKPADISKRIDSLIERDYLEKDDEDANVYNYLA